MKRKHRPLTLDEALRGDGALDDAPPANAGNGSPRDVQADGAPAPEVETDESSVRGELAEQREKYLRLAADFENYRKRMAKERTEAGARGQADLVKQMLDALDDIARFAHLDPTATDAATVVQGVDMVERKLLKALSSAGLEVVNPVDAPFDPERHEAVATEPAATPEEDHTVARVYQPGYVFKGHLLRPARVVVRQWSRGD